jgi:hypothetical protein
MALVDRAELSRLCHATDEILRAIPPGSIDGPINWADLSCVRALEWADDLGDHGVTVEIAEAHSGASKLQAYVGEKLRELGWANISVRTEW